jgi:hypothetical protein
MERAHAQFLRRVGQFCLLVLGSLAASSRPAVVANESAPLCRREFWVVNTRHAPVCNGLDQGVKRITYWKRENGRLVRKSLKQFLAGVDPSLTTTFYVHGDTVNRRFALRIADKVMNGVGRDVPAYRMVLWSWPSQHRFGLGIRGNVLTKARWSESQGYYLAWLVDKINPRTTLSLVGHSFGARTVAAALQGLATNRMAGYHLGPRRHTELRLVQAALVAPAMDNRWLWKGWRYGEALTQVDRMLVTRNPNDRLLRYYSDKYLPSGVRALGLTGIPNQQRLGDMRFRLTPFDAVWAGTSHRWTRYADAPNAASQLRKHFFYEDANAEELLGAEESPQPQPSDGGSAEENAPLPP